jgi:hypothetical protein
MAVLPHLSSRAIAKALDDMQAWRLSEGDDLPRLHRGVLKVLLASDTLRGLSLPLDLDAPRLEEPGAMLEWAVVIGLLGQAESVLRGVAHRGRIARLHAFFPGHAAQLERLRREAASHLRALRMRVDFVCRGPGEAPPLAPPADAARSTTLQ